jgi:hypothetical protein
VDVEGSWALEAVLAPRAVIDDGRSRNGRTIADVWVLTQGRLRASLIEQGHGTRAVSGVLTVPSSVTTTGPAPVTTRRKAGAPTASWSIWWMAAPTSGPRSAPDRARAATRFLTTSGLTVGYRGPTDVGAGDLAEMLQVPERT